MKQCILIVEDSVVNQKLLTKIFETQKYKVVTTDSGEAAFNLVFDLQPDLIILDIMLPGISGYTICESLKRDVRTRDIPVIFVSSLDSSSDISKGFEAGGVDYITKPFEAAEVLARVSVHLRLSYLQDKLEKQNQQLDIEKQKSMDLLCNVLPQSAALELLETGRCEPQLFPDATVCFVDIISFTAVSSQMAPEVILDELNEIFTGFDRIALANNCERMKTIGDAYLFVCGISEKDLNHAENVVLAARGMIRFLEIRNTIATHSWQLRIGVHSGSVVGGIVGTEKYLYDIFGDTVNVAARLESMADPMQINVSSVIYQLLKDKFTFSAGNTVEMKGKGKQTLYTIGEPVVLDC